MDQPSGPVPEQVLRFAPKPKPKPKPREDDPTAEAERALIAMLQKAAGISNEKYEGTTQLVDQPSNAASEQAHTFPPRPKLREDDPIDTAGQALLAMLQKAAGISNEKYELAGKLAGELRKSENRIKQLEAEVSHFRDRAARAEEWLRLISRDIESKLIAPQGASRSRDAGD